MSRLVRAALKVTQLLTFVLRAISSPGDGILGLGCHH